MRHGADRRIVTNKVLRLSEDLPMIVEIVEIVDGESTIDAPRGAAVTPRSPTCAAGR